MTDNDHLTAALAPDNSGLPAGLWPTTTAMRIFEAINICRRGARMGMVTGPSGIGKTFAAETIARAISDGLECTVVVVSLTRVHDNKRKGLGRIAAHLGMSVPPNMEAADIFDAVVQRMIYAWPRGSILILDEAQYMSDEFLHCVRDLNDETQRRHARQAILMIGTPDLADRIESGARGKARQFAPLRGRLYWDRLDPLAGDDFGAVAAGIGLPSPQAAKLVASICAGHGGMHNMRRAIDAAEALAGGSQLTNNDLRQAMLGLGITA